MPSAVRPLTVANPLTQLPNDNAEVQKIPPAIKTKKSSLAVLFGLVLCAVFSIIALVKSARTDEQQQIEFLTAFYKNYLSRPQIGMNFHLPAGSFYSKHADALLSRLASQSN